MTRALGLARLLLILVTLGGGYFAFPPTPRPATDSRTGGLEPRAGTDLWRIGAPEQHATHRAGSPAATIAGTAGAPSESPTPRPTLLVRSSNRTTPAASPRPPSSGRAASGTPRPSRKPPVPATRAPRRPQGTARPLPAGTTVTRKGLASTYGPRFSERWVALPDGPGWRFRVCGAGGCRVLVSTDAGPDRAMQRQGRIVDLPVGAFSDVCGVPWTYGLCNVTVTILGRI